ncbi:MAG: sigma-70 family RNA polymerase sigma factor [Actinomycetota bacterium]
MPSSEHPTIDIEQAEREDRLVREHLDLVQQVVTSVAHRVPSHVSRADLVSAGMLGLAQAARSFDPDRGIPFEGFAATRIRGALLDELRGRDWASRSVRVRARRLNDAGETLAARLGRTPTPEELAAELDVPVEAVRRIVDDVDRARVVNYDGLTESGEGPAGIADHREGAEEIILDRELKAYLMDAIDALPERLRRVVTASFFEDRPMHEIGAELGVTESRVSQMRTEALALLRDGLNANLDPDALPAEARPGGRIERRKAAYYAAIAGASTPTERLARRSLTTV